PELGLDLVERCPGAIFGRYLGNWQRPDQSKPRIVVMKATLRGRSIELADVITCLGVVFQNLVPVCETLWNIERTVGVGGEFNRDMLEVGRTLRTEIDDNVKD